MVKRREGFTLIELLVVIAIIAILAAILFPVFTAAKASANQSNCGSNMKQLLQACMLYESDYTQYLLPGYVDYTGDNSPWDDNDEHWPNLIDKYLRQMRRSSTGSKDLRGVYVCPSRPKSKNRRTGKPLEGAFERCYGYNWGYLGGYSDPFVPAADAQKPTKTIRLLENWRFDDQIFADYSYGCGSEFCYPPYKIAGYCATDSTWPPGWHAGKSCVGWLDGHVSFEKTAPPRTKAPSDADYFGVMTKVDSRGVADPYFRLDKKP